VEWRIVYPDEGIKKPDGSPGGGYCRDDTSYAMTLHGEKFILICPRYWQLIQQRIQDTIANQNEIHVGTRIDDLLTSGAVMLHKMMQWINQGSKHKLQHVPRRWAMLTLLIVGDSQVSVQGELATVYGFSRCAALVLQRDDATTNADGYRFWAVASALDQNDWSTGVRSNVDLNN
jgi:hypothetical protein